MNNSHRRCSNENSAGNSAGSRERDRWCSISTSRGKSLKPGSRRIGGPAVLSVTATVLTFLLRPVTTHSRGYIRDVKTRAHACTHARTYVRSRVLAGHHTTVVHTFEHGLGRDIGREREGGMLSYPFYHNNSPAMYKYTRIYVCTKVVGYVGWKVQGSTWSSPSSIYLSIHPLHPPELLFFSSSSSSSPPVLRANPLLALPFSACRTAAKQTSTFDQSN